MKQVLQSLKTGITSVEDIPIPTVEAGQVAIWTSRTLVSAGTEKMLVDFGKAGWIQKAKQQPDKVKMVLDKIQTDGIQPTIHAVLDKLDKPLPLGYCNVGTVFNLGSGVSQFAVGDRVVSNGKHAEAVCVGANLCAKVPFNVSDDEAAFTVLGAIALQGIRLAQPTLGEAVVVTGLGLVGLLTVQLLIANGCRVLGIDFDQEKLALAEQFGASTVNLTEGQDPLIAADMFSRGRGVDAVIVTATSSSSEPMHQAAVMCRKKGRIVLIGVTGLELSRADFYEKELTFQVSCSYGPGRYDASYEEKGNDYPVGYVRWTEQRNFEAVLDMMDRGTLKVQPLITHRFEINDAADAYSLISSSSGSLGVLLSYPGLYPTSSIKTVQLKVADQSGLESTRINHRETKNTVSFIGSGNYATSILIPVFKSSGVALKNIASIAGLSGFHAGRKFGFSETTTDPTVIFEDTETQAVVITTRHDSHAQYVVKALLSNKAVFVEKPLCLTADELKQIQDTYNALESPPLLMVGYNRRFAPHTVKIKKLLCEVEGPKAFILTVNAGAIPAGHWVQDVEKGGGRIIGEGCHFIDLLRHLAGVPIQSWSKTSMTSEPKDTISVSLKFEDGSMGTVHYFANGSRSFPKERLEVFAQGRVLVLDNFRKLKGFGWPNFAQMNLWRQNKGQKNCARAFVDALGDHASNLIPTEELFEIAKISISLAREN